MAQTDLDSNKSDKSERLLQLTCALLYSKRGLTKNEIYTAIRSYSQALNSGTNEESLNRMFERDKTDLRAAGIQIEMPSQQGDSDDQRYLIATDNFVWPKNAELNSNQLQLLSLAASAWSQASLEADANQALVRLRALGIEPAGEDLIGMAPRIKTQEPSFTPLAKAIEDQVLVTFNYRKPDGEVSLRKVEPWSLQNIDGQWLLQSFDISAKEVRNFLLKRIVSKVKIAKVDEMPVAFDKPSAEELIAAKNDLDSLIANQVAELKVKKDTQAWFHFHLDGNEPEALVTMHYMDPYLLAEELRDFALDITILKPKKVEEILREGFQKVVDEHA